MPNAEDLPSLKLRRDKSGFAISAAKRRKRRKTEESSMEDIMQLCDVIRETGFAIHCYHKHGHLEKVYENEMPPAQHAAMLVD